MKVSIILSAYSGKEYLKYQLDSIIQQSEQPDEIILINDKSPDDGATEKIIQEYAGHYSFIKPFENEVNMGWAASFMNGLNLVSDDIDIIMFCDQDDIWEKDKVKQTKAAFCNPKVNAVICDCVNVNENLEILQKHNNTGALIDNKFSFDEHFIYPKGVGAAMGLRRSFAEKYKNYWNSTIGHDRFFQVMAVMFDHLYFLDETLMYHRFHGNNATGRKGFELKSRIAGIEGNIKLLEDLEHHNLLEDLSYDRRQMIIKYRKFAEKRLDMLRKGSLLKWLFLPAYGLEYYPTNKTWFGDLKVIRSSQ